MSRTPGQFETLLKIRGDASGAKQAAIEAQQAMSAVEQQAARMNADVAGLSPRGRELFDTYRAFGDSREEALAAAQKKVTEEVLSGGAAYKVAAKEASGLSESVGKAAGGAAALGTAVSVLSPELGAMARLASVAKGAIGAIFSPIGVLVGAAVGALALFKKHLDDITEAARRAGEANAALFNQAKDRTDAAQFALARRGIDSEGAANASRRLQGQLEEEGFSPASAGTALSLAFDQGGQRTLTDEELRNAAALAETNPGALSRAIASDPDRTAHEVRRALANRRNSAVAVATRNAIKSRQQRSDEAVQAFDPKEIRARLSEGPEAVKGAELEDLVRDVIEVGKVGVVETGAEVPSITEDPLGAIKGGIFQPFYTAGRQKRAVAAAQRIGAISAEQAKSIEGRGFFSEAFGKASTDFEAAGRVVGRAVDTVRDAVVPSQDIIPDPRRAAPTTQPAPGPVTNIVNYGPNYRGLGPPETFQRTQGWG